MMSDTYRTTADSGQRFQTLTTGSRTSRIARSRTYNATMSYRFTSRRCSTKGNRRAIEYRLRTDADDPRMRHSANLVQVAMLLGVMADESDASLEEIAEAGVERAKAGGLHQRV
ncbi:hypothetical protein BRD01_04375 [Halobacteriales archaeon QS_8_65_32]|nr:MAG: hypothetical protein BRD01_04375 [Halobacteriales archaeon QS_8_65_32]